MAGIKLFFHDIKTYGDGRIILLVIYNIGTRTKIILNYLFTAWPVLNNFFMTLKHTAMGV